MMEAVAWRWPPAGAVREKTLSVSATQSNIKISPAHLLLWPAQTLALLSRISDLLPDRLYPLDDVFGSFRRRLGVRSVRVGGHSEKGRAEGRG